MTRDPDLMGLVEGYLDDFEGHTPLPDATRDAIRARLPSTTQRPAWWPGWRFPEMNTMMKYGLGAAAAVVVVIVGVAAFGGVGNINVGGPGADATASAAPSAAAQLPPDGVAIEPGRYTLTVVGDETNATFTVPAGWKSRDQFIQHDDAGVQLTIWKVAAVYLDACNGPSSRAVEAAEMSVEELVKAFNDQISTQLSQPRDVVVGGYAAVRVELATSDGVDPDACVGTSLHAWRGGSERSDSGHDALWIVDRNGDTVVVLAAYELGDPAAEAAAQEVIDTIDFDGA